ACVGAGQQCGALGGNCTTGSCTGPGNQLCGGFGQPCCGQNLCTAPRTVCVPSGPSLPGMTAPGTCVACGGEGQPCCNGLPQAPKTCDGSLACAPDYTCKRCGGPNEACCAN